MCDHCGWEACLNKSHELLEKGLEGTIETTVQGIHDWVSNNGHATERQIEAIDNIAEVQNNKEDD